MRKSKLFVLALGMPMLLAGLTSCNKHSIKHSEFVKSKVDYAYDVTYDDYNWGDVTDWMNSNIPNNTGGGMGCSSVHAGNFYGRSFDFFFTDMVECVVRTPAQKGRYASIGVAISDCKLTDARVKAINEGSTEEKNILTQKLLPFSLVDGINENGVVCNTNVIPAKDLTPHEGEEKYHTRGTNPGKEDLYYQFMPRYVLDNATSAKNAVELLAQRNITAVNSKGELRDYFGLGGMGYELHMMIGDKDETYVIELINDKMKISHSDVMTNFYLTEITESGMGLERFKILSDGLQDPNGINNIYDMANLIHQVQYSPCYKTGDSADTVVWPTEFCGVDLGGAIGNLTIYNVEQVLSEHWLDAKNVLDYMYGKIEKGEGEGGREPAENHEPLTPWISTHAEVFDIENKTLHLCTQEKYDNWQAYTL